MIPVTPGFVYREVKFRAIMFDASSSFFGDKPIIVSRTWLCWFRNLKLSPGNQEEVSSIAKSIVNLVGCEF